MFIVIIAFFSLIGLLVLHELSHFVVAKSFGVQVDEFGLGYPPRLFGKKIGETLYSINLIPFGAFIGIKNENLEKQPIWQRALILAAGIISFWIFSIILIAIVFMLGAPVQISDEAVQGFTEPKIQIIGISPDSPAEKAEIKAGDVILQIEKLNQGAKDINKVAEVQNFIQECKGQEIILKIQRGKEILEIAAAPRSSYPENEGALGIALVRVGIKEYSWYNALSGGFKQTIALTGLIISGLTRAVYNVFLGRPSGVNLVGPIGILDFFVQSGGLGVSYFLQTMALISLNLAIFNALPIPVADGGRLALLGLEKIRKKPLNRRTEQKIDNFFFICLLAIMLLSTIKDIINLFR